MRKSDAVDGTRGERLMWRQCCRRYSGGQSISRTLTLLNVSVEQLARALKQHVSSMRTVSVIMWEPIEPEANLRKIKKEASLI